MRWQSVGWSPGRGSRLISVGTPEPEPVTPVDPRWTGVHKKAETEK